MRGYSLDELRGALERTGLVPGDAVMVHSALFTLGRLSGHPIERMPQAILECLLEYLGPAGTVAAPRFNYEGIDFFKDYHARQMGPLSGLIAGRPDCQRTHHTIFSLVALGRLAPELAARDSLSAFAADGPFEYLLQDGAKALLLGAGMQALSLVHIAEERVGVPYRFWMEFPGQRPGPGGEPQTVAYRMFARDLARYPTLSMAKVAGWLDGAGAVRQEPLGAGLVTVVGFRDYVAVVEPRLRRDPHALVTP